MGTFKSRGLRGSVLEDLVNRTNEEYRASGLALIQKVPTPITPVSFDKDSHHITMAYFDQKSTVDYIGVVQGIPVCFDAKECHALSFPLANIHAHQYAFMKDFNDQDGIAFLLLYFSGPDLYYYMTFAELSKFMKRAEEGGPKHFKFDELDTRYYLGNSGKFLVPYLEGINIDLSDRDEDGDD